MSRIFLISDTHYNHSNVIRYCDRPFKDVYEMNKGIINSWNSVVRNDDICYHLGDFGFGNKEQISEWVRALNGRIRLILGNHDNHPVKWYLDCGFDRVYNKSIIVQKNISSRIVLLNLVLILVHLKISMVMFTMMPTI